MTIISEELQKNYYSRLDTGNVENIPNSLKEIAAWVCWREVPAKNPKAKARKVPINLATLANASSTDPSTWGTFEEAVDAFMSARNPELAGIGFVFSEADEFTGIDADDCRNPETGELDSATAELVRLVDSYTEVSPSLKGIKIYVKAKLSGDGNSFEFQGREYQIYDTGRYFAVTGLILPDSALAIWPRQQVIDSLLLPNARSTAPAAPPKPRAEDPIATLVDAIPDDELIAKIEISRQGEKFKQLMAGSKVGYAGYFAASGALCTILASWTRLNPERIDRIYRASEMCAPREWWWDDPAYRGRTRAEVTIEKACALAAGGWLYDPSIDPRAVVEIIDGETPTSIDGAEAALLPSAAGRGVFQRSEVVRVITLPEPLASRGLKRPAGTVMLAPMTTDALMEIFERLIRFIRLVPAEGGVKKIPLNCPSRLARMYLARRQWKLPILTGIIEAPCLRPDGTVLTEPGYDTATGLYLSTTEEWPEIGDPDKAAAEKALRTLLYPFRQFPFVDAEGEPPQPMDDDAKAVDDLLQRPSAAVLVCGIMTALQRRLLESAPIFGFTAPQPRYGKSMLARAIAIIATGRSAPAASLGADADEIRKMILGVLREGHLINNLDNIDRPLESPDLCKAITEPMYSDRVLGESKVLAFPTNVLWTCTGNNLAFRGDLAARALRCRIDAKKEKPEEREFKTKDLPAALRDFRPKLVNAALTILRAYFRETRPDQKLPNWGGFDQWSAEIRSAVKWVGMADSCDTRAEVADDDSEMQDAEATLWALDKRFATQKTFTLKEARLDNSPELREGMLAVAGKDGSVDVNLLGWWFRRWKDRVVAVDDIYAGKNRTRLMRLTQKSLKEGSRNWQVESLNENLSDAGS